MPSGTSERRLTIAVYGICRDEADNVEQWAASAREADHRILVDTGSTDDTVERARAAGVHVVSHTFDPWRFDVARNHALSIVPESVDLCLSLDLDEVLVPGWRDALEADYRPEATRYRYLYTWSWRDDGSPGLQYAGDKVHTRAGYTWRYPVHEVLVALGDEVQLWTGLEIHHLRDQMKSRAQYLPLLELAVAEDPHDDRNAHYLAREYMYEGRNEEAVAEFQRHLSLPSAKWPAERAQSCRFLAKCDPDRVEHWLRQAIAEDPDRREPWVDLAFLYFERQQWRECLAACQSGLERQRKPLEYLTEEHAWGSRLDDMAANCAFHLQDWESAVVYGERAVALEPTDERLRSNLRQYRDAALSATRDAERSRAVGEWNRLALRTVIEVPAPADLPAGWSLLNPSLSSDGERLQMLVRATNYRLEGDTYAFPDDERVVRSRLGIVDVDFDGVDVLGTSNWRWVDVSQALESAPRFPVHGIEDARLFVHRGEWWFAGAVRDFSDDGSIRQVVGVVECDDEPMLTRPWRIPSPILSSSTRTTYEKNWVFNPLHDELDAIWSIDPHVRIRTDTATRTIAPGFGRANALAPHRLRGGTPVFETPAGAMFVAHEVGPRIDEHPRPQRTYLHRFVGVCPDHLHIGPTWVLEELSLEYVTGAVVIGDLLAISFGRDDRHARVATASWSNLDDVLPPTCVNSSDHEPPAH